MTPRKTKTRSSEVHRPAAGQHRQVLPRHHAEGQGAKRRPRPAADAHLDHVPEVPRRHGTDPGGGSEARGKEIPPGHRAALSLARLGGEAGGHHRAGADRVHQPGGGGAAGREERRRAFCLSALAPERERRPPGRHRQGLRGHGQPDDERLSPARRGQQGERDSLHLAGRDPHARAAVREHAAGNARRGGRLRGVLHAAARW